MHKVVLLLSLVTLSFSLTKIPEVPIEGYTQATFTTYVDHFSANSTQFDIRYYYNDTFWSNDEANPGPIFFYTGNEGDVSMFLENSLFIIELAQEMNAAVFFAEHRYFGLSFPFENNSFADHDMGKYLSAHQALADFAYLVNYLKSIYKDAPVIAFGGSYGGMLAAWFRIKYPHLVTGAIAASAPVFHFNSTVDPYLFNEIVTDDYKAVSEKCASNIRTAHTSLYALTKDSNNFQKLQDSFITCDAIKSSDEAFNIIAWVDNALTYMAMTNYPYETNFLQPMPAWPVTVSCSKIQDLDPTDTWELMEGLRDSASVYYNSSGSLTCNQVNQQYEGDLGLDGWDYLTCTTLMMPFSSNGVNDFFLVAEWDYEGFVASCVEKYNEVPDSFYPHVYFGSDSDSTYPYRYASNIFFSNGKLDPWQSGAVLDKPNDEIEVFNITLGAHHLDLRGANPEDPQSVIDARAAEKKAITEWIFLHRESKIEYE
jgi:lysosomal Pro-X carboxypeptidase